MKRRSVPASGRRLILFLAAAAFTLGGCSNLIGPSGPPPQIYRLEPVLPQANGGSSASWQLSVARPDTTQTLDSERIALTRGPAMDYFADSQWNDTVPRLVQSLLVEAFEKSGRLAAVAPESSGLHADYLLVTEIRDFEARYAGATGAPDAIVDVEAKLLDPRGKVVMSLDARQTAPAAQNTIPAIITAFDQASGTALAQIVTWALQAPPP
jgi:cholesterol transport system auxiliary component